MIHESLTQTKPKHRERQKKKFIYISSKVTLNLNNLFKEIKGCRSELLIFILKAYRDQHICHSSSCYSLATIIRPLSAILMVAHASLCACQDDADDQSIVTSIWLCFCIFSTVYSVSLSSVALV